MLAAGSYRAYVLYVSDTLQYPCVESIVGVVRTWYRFPLARCCIAPPIGDSRHEGGQGNQATRPPCRPPNSLGHVVLYVGNTLQYPPVLSLLSVLSVPGTGSRCVLHVVAFCHLDVADVKNKKSLLTCVRSTSCFALVFVGSLKTKRYENNKNKTSPHEMAGNEPIRHELNRHKAETALNAPKLIENSRIK